MKVIYVLVLAGVFSFGEVKANDMSLENKALFRPLACLASDDVQLIDLSAPEFLQELDWLQQQSPCFRNVKTIMHIVHKSQCIRKFVQSTFADKDQLLAEYPNFYIILQCFL
ncbi:hypothetical protein RN001_014952 [Aquatica leii]|uniref:Uncharacterized protein n=1 Tax=Aquatica leii TaxID=1421715 RepID=A0AAN7SKV7_9COLE|nr:hypothetical protein RN001_014952 [Aquatica leii]